MPSPWRRNWKSAPNPFIAIWNSCATAWNCRWSSAPRATATITPQEVSAFPTLQITEGELFALLVAEKALQQYRGTTFERPLLSAFKKMAASLPDTISLNLADWEQTISFRTSAEPILNLENFDTLAKATAQRRQLELTYRKPGRRETELRLVDPYHLANINGEWFLFAWCHLRRDIRTFVPARIQAVKLTGKTFVRPQKFSLDKAAARQLWRAIRPGPVRCRLSSSTKWWPTTFAKRNGMNPRNCASCPTAAWNCA